MQPRLFIIIIILFSCSSPVNEMNEEIKSNKFIGVWKSVERIYPFTGAIEIKIDGSFKFGYGACMARGFSKGTWRISGDTIILKNTYTDSCLYLTKFFNDCETILHDNSTMSEIKTTKIGCEPVDFYEYVEFDEEKFIINNDTLFHLPNRTPICPEIKRHFYNIKTTANNTLLPAVYLLC